MATIKEVKAPDLGNVADAAIIEVVVKPGDEINAEDTLITLESDKASMDIPAPFAGKVKEVKVKVGDKISTGSLILIMEVSEGETKEEAKPEPQKNVGWAEQSEAQQNKVEQNVGLRAEHSAQPTSLVVSDIDEDEGDVHAGPGVRRLAREFGLDLNKIRGTGSKGRIIKEDLQNYVKAQLAGGGPTGNGLPSAPVVDFKQFGEVENIALSRIKKLTAINLHRNWVLIPHVTQFDEADITDLEDFRKSKQTEAEKIGVKLTPLVFIMKAVVASLKTFPTFNASLAANGEELILKKYFHIGVAVDTPDGLVVPVIRDVDKKGLLDLAKELGEVSAKARAKQLTAADMQGSSFTISSLGGIGGTAFTPIVNMPDVAILGVSKSAIKPVYQNNQFAPRLMLPLSLSYDHRVIDGAEGARFIVHLSKQLSDIRNWLL